MRRGWGEQQRHHSALRGSRPSGYKADVCLSYAKIEQHGRWIRKRLAPGLQDHEKLPGIQLFENLHKLNVPYKDGFIPLDWKIDALPNGVEAETRYSQKTGKLTVILSPETYEALERDEGRARNTLYHELGHAFLHTDMLVRMSRIPHEVMALQRATVQHGFADDTEWQAKAMAATLLMPARGLAKLEKDSGPLGGYQVQSCFGVSAECSWIRLETFRKRRRELLG